MTDEVFYCLLTFGLVAAVFSTSAYFRARAERQAGPLKTGEGRGLVVVLRLLGLVVVLPLLGYMVYPPWVAWARFALPDWVRWLAALIAIATVPLAYWTLTSLGSNISPTQATRQGHTLVTHGPYRWVRHPLYTTGLVFFVALNLLTGLWWLGAGMVLPIVILLRTRVEEARLIEAFGDEYRAYMQSTGRFLPRLVR